MSGRNYQQELESILGELAERNETPSLLLHSCCAPCSSYVLEYLSPHFSIIDYYYNPNIAPEAEERRRAEELERLIGQMDLAHPVTFRKGNYDPESFLEAASGWEDEPEGGERCTRCFRLRLREAAEKAREWRCTFFTTTLTISPHKDAERINRIGEEIAKEYGVRFLPCDFKKRDGYKRSIELSKEYDLYRQSYCGCVFSKRNDASGREQEGEK